MEEAINQLVVESQEKYFGKYRGFVVDNNDPEKRARVTLKVPSILDDSVSHWAEPCLPFGGLADQGFFLVPEINAQVWVEFEAGNIDKPIWTGTTWQQSSDVPQEAADRSPQMRQLKTPSGHILSFDDTEGGEEIRLYHAKDAELKIDPDGVVQLTDASGSVVLMDATASAIKISDSSGNTIMMDSSGIKVSDSNGNEITMEAGGVKVSSSGTVNIEGSMVNVGGSGGEPLIKGQSFLSLFATHMHTTTAPGAPTSPPIPQGEFSTLSMTSMVK
ncbi:phage baseplate assembly protein V [sulfur-oxidizing endosymbiont of Gigantopelta aegis]|uniref:phage baseplate assembly protein V n=1 Tax=sulfur-oxidizing endosymbiont of Gigantopelta aegis TaxID=2794934 RepID=UPI0018DE26E1|nr:phage baseplate assembly protein V [sulfur-oxidizing endosymbiont of Gigantopelta aegis]